MTLSALWPMAVFALAASISPGPVNLVCLSSGTRFPAAQGLGFVTGATLGFIALMLALCLGLHNLLMLLPAFEGVLRWSGVAFLLYLSLQLALADGRLAGDAGGGAPGFLLGVAMQWLNPKAWLAIVAGVGAYTGGQLSQALVFAALYLPICWLSLASWLCAGAWLRRYVQRPAVLVAVNRVLATLLAASCLYLIAG
ncbi:LysE family translocator [Parahaliea mediterranea]|uniref:LysE family transporter n=1 Tax=Parahaliea mediterranea TaxID=651086 RepID=A0A939DI79_9GAMM|nr:LysE family transporter [Parahaliea mediterranea]MBN7798595.1 LysE family transporter [Parahaliea mediterranea]